MSIASAAACILLATVSGWAVAQGGPPMVTDDPGTPGAGKWEINLAALGARTRSGRGEVSAPDADINYGWGDRPQVRVDVPLRVMRVPGEGRKSGLGAANLGRKRRL